MVRVNNRRILEETCRNPPFKIHLSRIQRCRATPRQIRYLFNGGERPILGSGEDGRTGRLDALTTLVGPGDPEHIIPTLKVQELSSMSRITRCMGQDELAAMSNILLSRCVINIEDFIKQSKNISEGPETQ